MHTNTVHKLTMYLGILYSSNTSQCSLWSLSYHKNNKQMMFKAYWTKKDDSDGALPLLP